MSVLDWDAIWNAARAHVDLYAGFAAVIVMQKRQADRIKYLEHTVDFLWDVIGKRATDKLQFLTAGGKPPHRFKRADP